MAITGTNRIANGVINHAQGSFLDTGTVKKSIVALGFVPKYVKLVNATDRTIYEWFDGMAAGTTLKTVAAGTVTLDTSDVALTAGAIDSGTVDTWTVYTPSVNTVGTPAVPATEDTDNSRLNAAGEVIVGFSIPAAVVITNKQFYWVAQG
jgi:hypothetical protein